MSSLFLFLRGYAIVRIIGCSTELVLNAIAKDHIPFRSPLNTDELTIQITVLLCDVSTVSAIAERFGCEVRTVKTGGFSVRYGGLRKRLPLLLLLAASVIGAITIPSFVWFYRVEGNKTVSSEQILRAVRDAGVPVGIYGPDIHPQQVRYRVLAAIPQLRWLTVTQNGGCAVITVREVAPPPKPIDRKTPRDLVAAIGGLITDVSALDGAACVKTGDVVTPGQVLISGTMDLEYAVRVCRAEGEVFARTWRITDAVYPKTMLHKGATTGTKTLYYLQIGKKRIKISPGSGFSDDVCDKMTERKALTLPGGYALPLALIVETVRFYNAEPMQINADTAYTQMQSAIEAHLSREMIAGTILKTNLRIGETDGIYTLRETAECEEMIARPQAEKTKGEDADGRTDNRRGTDGAAH